MPQSVKNEEYNPDLISLTSDDGKEYNFRHCIGSAERKTDAPTALSRMHVDAYAQNSPPTSYAR